ncbi:MoaD/ThiS family protein [Paenarthrobacter sp. YIM B13468]|uniref:MoaD/ThiS family protein n=1 Tax=Paenarthrobacter sp. YIM B13468 TaxID=3366295 RepID=UPI00367032BB
MLVRYYAAACSAAGLAEEQFQLGENATVADLLKAILSMERPKPPEGTPPLRQILSRSSFLLNEVAVRDHSIIVRVGDVVDVLPPFAGG